MRAIWKGAVSFGLVSIAVRLYSATEEKDIRFHQVHRDDGGRIKYQRICAIDGEEVEYDEIAKGYDIGGGEVVILTDEDFAELPLSTSHAIDVLEFVPSEQVDPILYAKAYYLEPEKVATKPYLMLRDALANTDRVAIVKAALRQREQLATLRSHEGVLVLNTMLWPDEVRDPDFDFLDGKVRVRPAELSMAMSLVNSMAGDFDPELYTDDYRAALQEVIDAKVSGHEIAVPVEAPPKPTAAIDLMAALRASVDRAKASRDFGADDGDAGDGAGPDRRRSARAPSSITSARSAKKTAPKKTAPAKKTAAAKSTAAKKTTTGKTATKKTAAAKKATPAKKTVTKKATPAKKASHR